jgi:hypothetical protein
MPIKRIAALLKVSPSSVHAWTRDIRLTPSQRAAIRHSEPARQARKAGNEAMRGLARERRLAAQRHGRSMAHQHDPLHLSGCMLFWAEGSRKRNRVEFTNSDPDMLRRFLEFLRQCYSVTDLDAGLALNVHLNNGLELDEIENWWLDKLGLPPASMRSHTVNTYSRVSRGTRRTLPYGTARVTVCSTFIVQSIYGAIQEYVGIERTHWLHL